MNQSDYDFEETASTSSDQTVPEEQYSRRASVRQQQIDYVRYKQRRLAVRLNRLIAVLIGLIVLVLLFMRFVNF